MDLSNPNNPLISDPGGPTWQINDWLAFPQSVEKVDSLWTDDDYLYFDDLRDLWYYRITRQDLTLHKLTLQSFLQPVHDILVGDADFQAIAKKQPEVSKRLAQLKSKVADRVADPKKLSDVPQLIWGTVTPVTIVKDVFRIAELWIHGAEMWVKEPDAVHLRLPISGTLTSADGRTVTLDTLE